MRVYLLLVAVIAVVAVAVVMIQRPALADDPDRTIPTITVSSPSSGEIHVVWGVPNDTSSLNSYRVSWAPWENNGFTSYKDANSDTGGNAYPDAPASSYTITGLAPGEYAVFVRSRYDSGGNGPFKKSDQVVVAGSAPQENATPTPEPTETPTPTPEPTETPTPEPALAPGTITGLALTSSRPGHLWVSWDEANPAPTEYRLNWAPLGEPFPSWNSRDGGNLWLPRTQQDFSSLVNAGVTYKLQMRAIYRDDPENRWSGPWSEVVVQRVRDNPPVTPTGLSVDSITYDGVSLSWSAPAHSALTGYRILRGATAAALETLVQDTGDLELTYTDTTTEDEHDTTYHYAVLALSLDGDGAQSAAVSATTLPRPTTPDTPVVEGAPAALTTLAARLDGLGGVRLSWLDPDEVGITGYRILRGDDALSMRVIKEDTGSASDVYVDASSRVNRTYVYAVQVRNAAGLSQLSNTVSVATLGAPTNLLLTASSDSEATLSWTGPDSSAVTGYHIRRGPSADALVTLVADTGTVTTTYVDETVVAESTYHYAVSALGASGEGPRSATASVTVPAAPPLIVPRDSAVIIDDEPPVSAEQSDDSVLVSSIGLAHGRDFNLRTTSDRTIKRAQIFTTGSTDGVFLIHSVKFIASFHNSAPDAEITINAVDAGAIGEVLYTLEDPPGIADIGSTRTEYSASASSSAVLEPSTTYALVLATTSGGFRLSITNSNDADPVALTGWSINRANSFSDTSISGGAWTVGGSSRFRIAVLGKSVDASTSEAAGEDFPGRHSQMRTTPGLVDPRQTATGELTAADDDVPAGSNSPVGLKGDYFRLKVEPGHQYRLQAFFKDQAEGSVHLWRGGSIKLAYYDSGQQAGLSPGADHNRDDGVTIVHFGAEADREYYVKVNAYDQFNGRKSRSYHGKYHLVLTDITGVELLLSNIWVSSSTPTDRTVGDLSWGQLFKTGNHEAGYKIDRLQVWLENVGSGTTPVVTIRQSTNSPLGSVPGTTVCTFAGLNGYASGILPDGNDVMDILYPNDACKDATLAKTTDYWLVFGEDGHDSNYKVPNVSTTSVASGIDSWQALGTLSFRNEEATTPAWNLNNGFHFLFRLWGTRN